MSQSTSVLDKPEVQRHVRQWVEAGDTNSSVIVKLKTNFNLTTSEKSIRRFRKRHKLWVPGQDAAFTRINDDQAEAQTSAVTDRKQILDDPDTMLRERGLDPTEWVITHMTPNMYEGPNSSKAVAAGGPTKITYYQTKFSCQRVTPPELQIFAPRTDGWKAPARVKTTRTGPRLVVVVGDQQAPFHDPDLLSLFTSWLQENKPQQGVSLGDTYDFPDIRPGHRVYPQHNAGVTECLQGGYDWFRGSIEASPDTEWTKLIGNHDERIVNILLDKPITRPMAEIQRPVTWEGQGGEYLHALSHAGRLDELGINVIETGGSYEHGQVNLSKHLAVRHGWIARKGAGNSALATLEATRYSIIVGHTHRQSIVHHTSANIDGKINTLAAAEAGCMCRVEQIPAEDGRMWPGYTVSPDWQQGFMTATIWPDGRFNLDPATYVDGTLLWRDQRYTLEGK